MSSWAARVTRVDQPEPGLLTLTCRASNRDETLAIVTLPGSLEVGLLDRRPRGSTATTSTTQLRHHVEGARIDHVERSKRAIRVLLASREGELVLIAAPAKPYGAWWLRSNGDVVLRAPGAPSEAPAGEDRFVICDLDDLRTRGVAVLKAHRDARLHQLRRALDRHLKRLRKKRDAVLGDLARAEQAEELQEKASLLLAHSSRIPPGATFFEAPAWNEPSRLVRIELDPRATPAELGQRLFAQAKRLKRGLAVVPGRLATVETELGELEDLSRHALELEPAALESRLEELGVSIAEPKERERRRRRGSPRLPYREFSSADGTSIFVGRGAADNDQLTLRVARPQDLWLHARGVTGAHVVVRLDKGQTYSSETLVDAATLAAHFSDYRNETVVDVLYTPRRFVRKRRGSPIGSVTLERENVIAVRVEARRLERLLANEKRRA